MQGRLLHFDLLSDVSARMVPCQQTIGLWKAKTTPAVILSFYGSMEDLVSYEPRQHIAEEWKKQTVCMFAQVALHWMGSSTNKVHLK